MRVNSSKPAVRTSEEIWSSLGSETLCICENWSAEDVRKKIKLKLAIQINGKTREIIEVEENASKDKVLEIVMNNSKIKKNLLDKKVKREVYVPGKIVNLVI